MSDTSVKGREVLLKRPPMTIFSLFSDLSLLVQNVPEEYGGRIQADKDSVHIEYKGIKFGIVVDRREPFSLVSRSRWWCSRMTASLSCRSRYRSSWILSA